MTDLASQLERLGLSQYLDSFVSEGFDTWETVLDITESDLNYLNVKLGHRRKLQRAIAESRGQPPDKALINDGRKSSNAERSDDSGTEAKEATPGSSGVLGGGISGSGTKRKYRRHPKPDPNAPERPPSAYVIFSNQVREEIKGQDLSFTEIAKVVGERWQVLPAEVKEACEQQANLAKEKYNANLTEYKKTAQYSEYQDYLVEFKAKYGQTRTEGKRTKLKPEISAPLQGTINQLESLERGQGSRSVPILSAPRSSRSSSPSGGAQPHVFRRPSLSASPALHSDAINSPARADPYSPDPRSPALSASMSSRDQRPSQLPLHPHEGRSREPGYHHVPGGLPSVQTSYQSHGYRPGYEGWPDPGSGSGSGSGQSYILSNLPRGISRGDDRTPPLVRNDSTISSADSAASTHLPTSLLPPIDSKMPARTLPQPIMGGSGSRGLPMDLRSPAGAAATMTSLPQMQGSSEQQRSSNWPALLRAIEIAREQAVKSPDAPAEQPDESP